MKISKMKRTIGVFLILFFSSSLCFSEEILLESEEFQDQAINDNEAFAQAHIYALVTALEIYKIYQTPPQYAQHLQELSEADPPYFEETSEKLHGYVFVYTPIRDIQGLISKFHIKAIPVEKGKTGNRNFFIDETGVVKEGIDETGIPLR